jgi:hypothetical protein
VRRPRHRVYPRRRSGAKTPLAAVKTTVEASVGLGAVAGVEAAKLVVAMMGVAVVIAVVRSAVATAAAASRHVALVAMTAEAMREEVMVREVKVMEAAAAAGESPGKEVKAGELVAA